ncbi:MAG: hypothetical protein WBG73_12190 [Coleofasciculaceae cyanobacterium]
MTQVKVILYGYFAGEMYVIANVGSKKYRKPAPKLEELNTEDYDTNTRYSTSN